MSEAIALVPDKAIPKVSSLRIESNDTFIMGNITYFWTLECLIILQIILKPEKHFDS